MPAPDKRFRVDRIVRGQVNGEAVEQAMMIWFRDRASLQVVIEAFADQYNYNETITMPQGQVRINDGITQVEFFQKMLTRIMRETVVNYRQRLAQRESVAIEAAELPN